MNLPSEGDIIYAEVELGTGSGSLLKEKRPYRVLKLMPYFILCEAMSGAPYKECFGYHHLGLMPARKLIDDRGKERKYRKDPTNQYTR